MSTSRGRQHLGHLDPRRSEQDVDARRVAPEDIAKVGFGDPVGRQVEDGRRVAGDLQQRAQIAELEAAVDQDGALIELAEGDRQVEGDGRLADAAFRREDASSPASTCSGCWASKALRTESIRDMSSKPENGIARTPWMPASGSVSTGFWGTVRTMTGTPSIGVTDLLDELRALHATLKQSVHDDDVGPQLAGSVETAFAPSVTTSRSLTRDWALSRPRMY